MNEVSIGNVKIGDEYPTAFMAEIGTFFDKNIDKAIYLIDKAIDAGSDIIKSEILHDADVILKKANLQHTYKHHQGSTTVSHRQIIEEKTVSLDNYKKIVHYINQKNKPFVASVYDMEGIDFMVENNGAGLKLWKNNYNNFPLIRHAARSGLPIIFDMAFTPLSDIATSVDYARKHGAKSIIVNYHPGKTPTLASEHQLSIIPFYKNSLNIPIGLACHYVGELMIYVAIGCGLNIVEKGVYDDITKPEQSVMIASELDKLPDIIKNIKDSWYAIGKPPLVIPKDKDTSLEYGLTARTPLQKGEMLSLKNVRFSFPALGIPVKYWDIIQGNKIKENKSVSSEINWTDIDFIKNNRFD